MDQFFSADLYNTHQSSYKHVACSEQKKLINSNFVYNSSTLWNQPYANTSISLQCISSELAWFSVLAMWMAMDKDSFLPCRTIWHLHLCHWCTNCWGGVHPHLQCQCVWWVTIHIQWRYSNGSNVTTGGDITVGSLETSDSVTTLTLTFNPLQTPMEENTSVDQWWKGQWNELPWTMSLYKVNLSTAIVRVVQAKWIQTLLGWDLHRYTHTCSVWVGEGGEGGEGGACPFCQWPRSQLCPILRGPPTSFCALAYNSYHMFLVGSPTHCCTLSVCVCLWECVLKWLEELVYND